jgi:hypothetical protein
LLIAGDRGVGEERSSREPEIVAMGDRYKSIGDHDAHVKINREYGRGDSVFRVLFDLPSRRSTDGPGPVRLLS